jgi:L-seryl-tRNA(Ser) seleniumtransferase
MGFYGEIGVRPFINATGRNYTRYGGSIMPEEVVAAMVEASKQFVNMFELQDRVGEAIAKMTRNEAAFVSCGATSGILLAVAACITGTDSKLADRLPDTRGMRNQIIISRYARGTEADVAVRAAGGQIVEVGGKENLASAQDYLAAINDQTAAILLIAFESELDTNTESIIRAAREKNIPVLLDGAYAIPPKENLWHYTRDLGMDALITSGGKAMRGPQSTGLVLGKTAIIEGCKFHSSPNLRIGRGMKVGKEEFAGIYAALKLFLATDFEAQVAREAKQIAIIAAALDRIPGIIFSAQGAELQIRFDPAIFAITAESAVKALLDSDPSILVSGRNAKLTISARLLQDREELVLAEQLRKLIDEHRNK